MDFMYSNFLKIGFLITCFLLALTSLPQSSSAQYEEEMKSLRMFYKEKDLVVSPTRHQKHISQVAENITVVTAREIEEMNAHTVAEVLNRIPGLFVNFNQDFGAASLIYTQGSEERHVLVLLDGIPWNFLASGAAETNSIPVGIIERVEVIKGPASSAWGSSLGGVINIITKQVRVAKGPSGSVSGSYGKEKTQDYRAEVSGLIGPAGYYIYGGRQYSDGLLASRDFDNHSFYSKFHVPLSEKVNVGLSIGYSDPKTGLGDFPSGDISSSGESRTFFTAGSLEAYLTRELSINLSLYRFDQKFDLMNDALGLGMVGSAGEPYLDTTYDEAKTGGSGKLVWTHGSHTAVLGMDIEKGALDQTLHAGSFLQSMGLPETTVTHPDIEKWALYVNDTIVIDRWSITPGVRYDHNSITGSFTSPSLGITYRLGEETIVRASVARGFTIPPLSWTSGGSLFLDPNPDLEPEKVWSYQAGVESAALKYLWAKATFFRHELEDALVMEPYGGEAPMFNDIYVNRGKIRRQGLEIEAETIPVYNLSLMTGFVYVNSKPPSERGFQDIYSCNLGLRYDNRKSLIVQIFGHYVWWDFDDISKEQWDAEYDDFIWDLNITKKIYEKKMNTMKLFVTAHNLFNGSQYTFGESKNPDRWMEAGIRIGF